jgi:hypothetical protein
VRDRGSDQGGHWPVGIWFAMVGVSAGTVASFSLIGWTFAKELYGAGDGAEPLDYDPQTVVIEAEETPDPVSVAGGGEDPIGPGGPGPDPQIAVSPAEPQAERIAADEVDPPENDPREEEAPETSAPPHLVPVDEDDGCGREEAAPDWDSGADHNGGNDNDQGQGQGHDWDHYDLPEPDLDLGLDLDLVFDQADIELDLEFDGAAEPAPEFEPEAAFDPASDYLPDTTDAKD